MAPLSAPPDIYVVAGSHEQYLQWCRARYLRPGQDARYVDNPRRLLGVTPRTIAFIGTWESRNDLVDIEERLAVLKHTCGTVDLRNA